MSIFKLISEILAYCNRQTVFIRQLSAILPLLIHGPIRIFLQKYTSLSILSNDNSLLSKQLKQHVFQERTIATALRAARDALWPGGIMQPPRIPPTPSESIEIRRTAEVAALNALPHIIRKLLLGTEEQQQNENMSELFDLLGRKECNKHLLMFLIDLMVVRLIPELTEMSPKELYDWRML